MSSGLASVVLEVPTVWRKAKTAKLHLRSIDLPFMPTDEVVTSMQLTKIIDRATWGNRFEVDCGEYRRIPATETWCLFLWRDWRDKN